MFVIALEAGSETHYVEYYNAMDGTFSLTYEKQEAKRFPSKSEAEAWATQVNVVTVGPWKAEPLKTKKTKK